MATPPSQPKDLESIKDPSSSVTIHGVLTALSPDKKGSSSNYFEGFICDESMKRRLFGFNTSQRKKLKVFHTNRDPVLLQDCEIKKPRRGEILEVQLKSSTIIAKSPKNFDIPAVEFEDQPVPDIQLDTLDDVEIYQLVNVRIKVLSVMEPVTVGAKRKQDVTVADQTATTTVCLWEQNIGLLNDSYSYELRSFAVREFSNNKYLTMTRNDSSIIQIADIGEVVAIPTFHSDSTIRNAKIIAVMDLQDIKTCLRCSGRIEPATPPYGRCSKATCNMSQLYDFCPNQLSAKLLFMSGPAAAEQQKMVTLNISGSLLKELATDSEVTERKLLSLPPIRAVKYDDDNKNIISIQL